MNVLVVDAGGSNVRILATGEEKRRKAKTGPDLTPRRLVHAVVERASDWYFDAVSVGVPAPVRRGEVVAEPARLGTGWAGFDFEAAFGRPTRVINHWAMQALGSYGSGRMLFVGLGSDLGAALVDEGRVLGLEAGHLPYRDGTLADALGGRGRERHGKKKWRRAVAEVVGLLREAVVADYVVIGGSDIDLLTELPPKTRRGHDETTFRGGFRLWDDAFRPWEGATPRLQIVRA